MKEQVSLLKQERLKRNWSRAHVEALTEGRISQVSLERWEEGKAFPRSGGIKELYKLYGKTPEQLGLDKSDRMMLGNSNTPTSQGETPIMSDLIRRSALSDLGSYLIGLVSTWPHRNHHYEELQEGINRAIIDHSTLTGQDTIAAINRRQALMSLGLVPIQLSGSLPIADAKKTDTDSLLAHCAAGITAAWYLRRGKELTFVSDLTSSYISILKPLVYSHSEAYRKASATLLAQSFMLKSNLARGLQDDDQEATAYEAEAIRYALLAENTIEQAIANREMAIVYWRSKKYKQALPYAETAYGLARSSKAPQIIRSLTASGLAVCQATSGHLEDAQISLKEARDLFDPRDPMVSISYSEAILNFGAGQVYQHIGKFGESITLHAKSLTIPDISAMGAIECRINYAKTEVSRDDIQTRDMGLCIKLLTEAMTGATELDSERYKREAREVYDLLRAAWHREDAIKKLGREHFGLK